jgi:predicted metal-dependent hydrolase
MDATTSAQLVASLIRDAERIAARFGLRYRVIEAERPSVRRRYGVCYSDGTIRIRLRHASTGRPLKYSSLVNTLCHELAHLKHFNHGLRFRRFYRTLLEYARAEGIYRPALTRRLEAPAPAGASMVADGSSEAAFGRSRRRARAVETDPRQLTLFA